MNFLDNKYSRWYWALMERGRLRSLSDDSYRENHHIVPESFFIERSRNGPKGWLDGDPESPENKVDLTGREHGLAHWLLTKMTTGVALIKCQDAFEMMGIGARHQERGMSRLTCRAYERNRMAVAANRSERMNENNPMNDPDARKRVGDSKRGKSRPDFSKEWRDKLSASRVGEKNGMYGKKVPDERRALLSHLASLRTYSDATNNLRREASSGRKEITNGTIFKKVKQEELQEWLNKGWIVKGKSRKKKQK